MSLLAIYKNAFAGLSRQVWQLASMMLINRLGTLILPFLVLYTTVELGWSPLDGGFAASSFGFGSLAGAYLGGILTDKIGYHRTMLLGLFSAGLIFFVTQFFSEFYSFCALLFVGSMAADVLRPALFSGLKYVTDEQTQTRAISLMRMAFNLGIAIGPAVAGALVIYTGYRSIFIIDAVTCLAAGVFMILYIKDEESQRPIPEVLAAGDAERSPYGDYPFLLFLLSNILVLIAFFQIVGTVPLYIKEYLEYTEQAVGFFFTVNGLIIFIFEMLIISYLERKAVAKFDAMVVGGIMMAVALLCLAADTKYLLPFVCYTLFASFGEIINFPFISTTAMDRSSDASRGKYMGLTSMSFSLALIIAPVAGTYLLDAYGFQTMFFVMFVINIVGVAGYFLSRKVFQ